MRKINFTNDECYHIFNRGVDKRKVFLDGSDYRRFLLSMDLLNDKEGGLMISWRDFKKANPEASLDDFLKPSFRKRKRLVEIIAYCLNPNHYHFLLKQIRDKGIEKFMHKIGTSYTKYFNEKQKRNGALFQGKFKAAHIESNEQLLYLSAYVNKNNFIHGYNENNNWPYSSLAAYLGKREDKFIRTASIIEQFGSIDEYNAFLRDNAQFMREKKEMESLIIEE